jgi:myosin-5
MHICYCSSLIYIKTSSMNRWAHMIVHFLLYCSLLLRRECCSFSNGEYVKAGLDELEHWCHWLTEEVTPFLRRCCNTDLTYRKQLVISAFLWKQYAGSSWDELKHIRQAVTLLILEEKHSKSLKEITDDFCPVSLNLYLYNFLWTSFLCVFGLPIGT